jgi:hypothetical protein
MGPFFSGGNLVAGAKIYHYIAGTNSLLNVYVDRNKATPAAQPVVADSQGIASFYGDGIYKLVVADPANVADPPNIILYTFDNVNLTDGSQGLVGKGANIVSASTLILGSDGNEFLVTGANTINLISGVQAQVTLVFAGACPLTYGGNLLLAGGLSYTTSPNDVLTFINEGLSGGNYIFREVARLTYVPPVGGAGSVPMALTQATNKTAYVFPFLHHITGLNWQNDATDPVNDLDINPGGCMDSTGAYWMNLSASLVKQSDVAWAVGGVPGAPQGGLDTGAVGNNDYYIWLIARPDTGVVDALFSLSSTAPTMPTNYTLKRLMGWFKRVGGTVVAFHTYETEGGGIDFLWDVPTLDVNVLNTLANARRTDAVKVPLNVSVLAHLNVAIDDASGNHVWVYCPDLTDTAPAQATAPLVSMSMQAANPQSQVLRIRTSATGLVAARGASATVLDAYRISTQGFIWARRT